MKPADAQAIADLRRVQALRQAVRDAQTLPERFLALCDYQGALSVFVDLHWARIESAFLHYHSAEAPVQRKPDPRLPGMRKRAAKLARELQQLRAELGEGEPA